MTRTLTLKETSAGYAVLPELTEPVTEPLVVKHNGQTLGVLISEAEYQQFAEFAKQEKAKARIATQRRMLEREMAAYERMKSDLLKTHKGQYVAILDGQLIDADSDEVALAKRVYAKHGYRTLLMRGITETEQVYHVPHNEVVRQ